MHRGERDVDRRTVLQGVGAAALALPGVASGRTSAQASGGWPQYRHDARNSGRNPDVAGPREGVRARWTLRGKGDSPTVGSPAVADGRVYVPVGDRLLAVDATTGERRWDQSVGYVHDGGPALLDGGSRIVIATSDGLRALNADGGAVAWKHDGESAGVTTHQGLAYALLDGAAVALSPDGTVQWRTALGESARSVGTAAGSERLFALADHGDQRVLHALDAGNGATLWTASTGEYPRSPAVSPDGGTVYLNLGYRGVRAFDASDGAVRWTSEEAVGDSLVVAGGMLHGEEGALDASTGERVQDWNVGTWSPAKAVMGSETLYVANAGGRVIAYDPDGQSELWRYYAGDAGDASPAVAAGAVFVPTSAGHLHALEAAPGVQPPEVRLSVEGDVVKHEQSDQPDDYGELLVENGTELTFDASGSTDPDGRIEQYRWYGLGDGVFEGPTLTHTFTDLPSETHSVRSMQLVVIDDDRATGGLEVMVTNTIRTRFETSPSQPRAGEAVTFTAKVESARPVSGFRWDFGDDGSVDIETEAERVEWTFVEPGEHTVALTATDSEGATATVTETVQVERADGTVTRTEPPGTHSPRGSAVSPTPPGTTVPDGRARTATADAAVGAVSRPDQGRPLPPELLGGGALAVAGVGGLLYWRTRGTDSPTPASEGDRGPSLPDEEPDDGDASGGEPDDGDASGGEPSESAQATPRSERPDPDAGAPDSVAGQFAAACEGIRSCAVVDESGPVHAYSATLTDGTDARVLALAPDIDPEGDVADLFTRTAQRWGGIAHNEHVATVHDTGEEPRPWLAFDPGVGTLADGVDGLDRAVARDVLLDVVDALRTAGLYNISHESLAPGTVHLSGTDVENLTATVADWGLSTRVHAAVGEPRVTPYTAPEQLDGDGVGEPTDVYRLGAVAYHALTGQPPFRGEGDELARVIRAGELSPPSERGLPATLDDTLGTAMALDPDDRFDSPAAFRSRLVRDLD